MAYHRRVSDHYDGVPTTSSAHLTASFSAYLYSRQSLYFNIDTPLKRASGETEPSRVTILINYAEGAERNRLFFSLPGDCWLKHVSNGSGAEFSMA